MDRSIGNIKEKSLATIKQQMLGLFSDAVIQKAKVIVEKYNSETEAILLSEGLMQIRKMLQTMIDNGIDYHDPCFNLIVDEWKRRVVSIEKIINKSKGSGLRKAPSYEDKRNAREIYQLMGQIVGKKEAMPFQTIIPLLQEAKHD